VVVQQQVSHHQLGKDFRVLGNPRGLLECGVQVTLDADEPKCKGVKVAISYTGSVGTTLWSLIKEDRLKVRSSIAFFWLRLIVDYSLTGWIPVWMGWSVPRLSSTRPSVIVWKMWRSVTFSPPLFPLAKFTFTCSARKLKKNN
jgi:hypothetical protein